MEVVQRRQAYKPSCHQFDAQPLCRHRYRKMWIVSLMAQSLWITSVLCCEVLLLIVVEYGRIVSLITGKSKSGCSFIAWGVWNTTICSWPWCKIFCCMCSMWGESMLSIQLHFASPWSSPWLRSEETSRKSMSLYICRQQVCRQQFYFKKLTLHRPPCSFLHIHSIGSSFFFTVLLFQKTFYPFKIKGKFSDYL